MQNWGLYIKKLREEAGLTQPELAQRSGLTRSHISRIELAAYQGCKQGTHIKLAEGLGMSKGQLAEAIYGGDGNKESANSAISEIRRKLRYLENELKDSEE